jgi:predicted hydrocarbon binding protein
MLMESTATARAPAVAAPTDSTHGRHNYYNDEDFFRPDPVAGVLRDAFGRRVVRAPADLLAALTAALEKEVGDAAGEVLYKLGQRWGAEEMRACVARAPQEFGVQTIEQMNMNVLLETWRWPLAAAGWGAWRYDFRFARQGMPVVELRQSAAILPPVIDRGLTRPVCHLYAGLFAACFSHLAGRELVGVELQCAATGADCCRFVVTTPPRAASAVQFRDEGASADEVLQRLGGPPVPAAPEGSTVHDHDATPPPAGGRGNRRDRRPAGRPDARR